jgi:hypothetical protein
MTVRASIQCRLRNFAAEIVVIVGCASASSEIRLRQFELRQRHDAPACGHEDAASIESRVPLKPPHCYVAMQ